MTKEPLLKPSDFEYLALCLLFHFDEDIAQAIKTRGENLTIKTSFIQELSSFYIISVTPDQLIYFFQNLNEQTWILPDPPDDTGIDQINKDNLL